MTKWPGELEAGAGVQLEQVWATLPKVAGKGCMLGWQLEEEAELDAFRGGLKTMQKRGGNR